MDAEVLAVLEEHFDLPDDHDAELGLESLTLIRVAEALEERFDFVLKAKEVTPAHFGSVAAILAFVRTKT